MTTYPLRLRPPGRITIHAARKSIDGARTRCGADMDLIGTSAAHLEPDLDVTCRGCRTTPTNEPTEET